MEFCSDYHPNRNQDEWLRLKERYAIFRSGTKARPLIPKLIHQIWLGGNMPESHREFASKLKRANPGMEYKLWDESNIDFELRTGDLMDRATNFGQKSDILRYEILHKFGGIYMDMDFLAVRPLDPLLHAEFFTGIVYHPYPSLANGLIGAAPGHAIIDELLQRIGCNDDPDDIMGIMKKTGPFLLTDVFMELYPEYPGSVALPNSYFYPYPNAPRYKTLGDDYNQYIKPETLCVHLWHCSWMKAHRRSKPGLIERIKNRIFRDK